MNTASKIAKETTITFSGLVYGNINRYLYTALLARWVGVEFLGIYSLANSIMLISEVLAKMGLETGVMRFVSRLNPEVDQKNIQETIASALRMTAIFSLIIMVALIVSSGFIVKDILNEPPILKLVIIIFAITIPFNALTNVSAFATQGFKKLKYKILVTQLLNPTLLFVTMVVCYFFISTISAIMVPMLFTGIVGFLVMTMVLKRVSGIRNNQIRDTGFNIRLLKFSYPLMFVTMLGTLMHWMDILMLGYFTDVSTVGLYHPAARTAGLLQALLLSFLSIYAPMASQFHGERNHQKLGDTYRLVSRWLLMSALPISAVFILFPKKVLLLFGPAYLESSQILIILTVATLIQAAFGAAGPTLSMSGHTKLVLWNTIGAFTLNIGFNIWLIPEYGIIGAAMATLVSLLVLGLVRVIEVAIILKMNFVNMKFMKPIFSGFLTYLVLIVLKPLLMNYHTLITLGLAGLTSFSIFGFFIWIMRIESEDKDFLYGLGVIKETITKK